MPLAVDGVVDVVVLGHGCVDRSAEGRTWLEDEPSVAKMCRASPNHGCVDEEACLNYGSECRMSGRML